MANTLTNLMPDLYESLDVISRELVGFIPAVARNSSAERAAVGQQIRSFVTPASTAADITPGQQAPDTGDQTIGNKILTISKARGVPVRWNGEEQKGMNSGAGYGEILRDQFAQAMRTLVNEMETDLASTHVSASRAYGTAGTTPFASTLVDTAQGLKIMKDNGAPTDLQMVIDTSAGAAMRTLTQLTKVNEGGDSALLRQGMLLDVHGFQIRESAQVKQAVTVGTGTSYVTNTPAAATLAVGATTVGIDTGSGTVLAGDVVTFAGDTNKYIVATGVAAAGDIVLAAPGLRETLADGVAMTIVAAATRNMFFDRSAIQFVTRAPAIPEEGDQAEDAVIITDPRSGISFEVRLYKEYRQVHYEIAAAWGWLANKSEHIGVSLG